MTYEQFLERKQDSYFKQAIINLEAAEHRFKKVEQASLF